MIIIKSSEISVIAGPVKRLFTLAVRCAFGGGSVAVSEVAGPTGTRFRIAARGTRRQVTFAGSG